MCENCIQFYNAKLVTKAHPTWARPELYYSNELLLLMKLAVLFFYFSHDTNRERFLELL